MKLSLVVPAYNEEGVVGSSVRRIDAEMRRLGVSYEILVGDDGSTDGTAAEVRNLGLERVAVIQRPHRGKGGILTAAMLEGRGEYVGFVDADLEIDIAYFGTFLEALEDGYDVAVASKNLDPASARSRRFTRRVTTTVYNFLVRLLFRSPLSDHQGGMKLFRGTYLRSVLPTVKNTGWLWDTEVLISCLRDGKRIKEIPVEVRPRRDGYVNVATTSWSMLRDMLRLYRSTR